MQVVRLTIDLLRPVPVAPLTIATKTIRDGRKIQLSGIRLATDDDTEVVRATVLKIRAADHALPLQALDQPLDLPLPEQCAIASDIGDIDNPFLTGVSVRVARGAWRQPGPAAIWFRADRPLVHGAPTSALMRAALTADFGNGTAAALDFDRWTFINGDLSINLSRLPIDDWILVDAETWLGPAGNGIAFTRLADRRGYFGCATQSIVVEPR